MPRAAGWHRMNRQRVEVIVPVPRQLLGFDDPQLCLLILFCVVNHCPAIPSLSLPCFRSTKNRWVH
jgi:hypothetical protein